MSQPFAFTFRDRLYATWDKAQSALIEQLDQWAAQLSLLPDTPVASTDGIWINVPFDATSFAMALAGNSWSVVAPTPGSSFYVIAYTLIGTTTMLFNLDVPRSNLTVGTPFNQITVKMPPGYRIAGVSTAGAYVGRTAYGKVGLVNGGVAAGGFISASPGDTTLTIQKDDGSNFVADAALGFTLRAQLFLEVAKI